MNAPTPTERAERWLRDFDAELTAGRFDAAAALFEDGGCWRDLTAFTWTLRTMVASTAMRTATPFCTCWRITDCAPSATAESISTPRFIGPGCITIASGRASASFSAVRP